MLRATVFAAAGGECRHTTECWIGATAGLSIIYNNQGSSPKATRFLEKFLQASQATGNTTNHILALNALGVNYQIQGRLSDAVAFHTQHLDMAHDHTGQFIAYTNLGVALAAADPGAAKSSHEGALRAAVQVQKSAPTAAPSCSKGEDAHLQLPVPGPPAIVCGRLQSLDCAMQAGDMDAECCSTVRAPPLDRAACRCHCMCLPSLTL